MNMQNFKISHDFFTYEHYLLKKKLMSQYSAQFTNSNFFPLIE